MPKNNKKKAQKSRQPVVRPNRLRLSLSARTYLASQLYPGTMPAKIPDEVAVATTVVAMTYDFHMTANANGVAGVLLWIQGSPQAQLETSTSTDAALNFGTLTLFPGNSSFTSAFSGVRPVSASLEIIPTMSSQTDSGSLTLFTGVGNNLSLFEPAPTSFPGVLAMRDNVTMGVTHGGYVRYKTFDNSCELFTPSTSGFTRGILGAHGSGLTAGATFRIKAIINYECLASNDTLSYQSAASSPSDPAGYSIVKSIMSKVSSFSDFDGVKEVLSASYGGLMSATGSKDVLGLVDKLLDQYMKLQQNK